MRTKIPVPENLTERIELTEEKFPNFCLKEDMLYYLANAEHNTPVDGTEPNEYKWISIKLVQDFNDLKIIAHPHWIEDWDFEWPEILKHVSRGVTFSFYWKEGFLAWEC